MSEQLMTNAQQQYVNTLIESFYAEGTAEQHAEYRELASRVYANALRNPETSLLQLKLTFEPLQTIATSAAFTETAAAVGRAITQPFSDSAESLQGSQVFAKVAATAIQLVDDPLANIKSVWNGVQASADAAYQLAQHATGMLTMEERQRLAVMYDLPHEQRIKALHGETLNDTAAMVSVGSLPGIFPNAMTKARIAVNDAGVAFVHEVESLPRYNGSYPLPAVVGTSISVDSNLPQVLGMATKDPDARSSSTEKKAATNKKFNMADYEFPDPDYDNHRIWYKRYLEEHVKGLSDHMATLGLKNEATQIKKQLDYMLNVQVTANVSEYNLVFNEVQGLVTKAIETDYQQAIASGLSPAEAESRPDVLTREFNKIQLYVQYERDKRLIDLAKDQSKFELQERARVDPDSVGYARTAYPKSITERELHHDVYLTKFRESIADLRVKLELVGLNDRADALGGQVREMLTVSLEDSQSIHNQRVAEFMKIEEEAKGADMKNASTTISDRYLRMIQEEIGADLTHIKEEIGHDREYHIDHQLWKRQSGDERRALETLAVDKAREELFGYNQSIATQQLGPEL